jgi:hypothetical protein
VLLNLLSEDWANTDVAKRREMNYLPTCKQAREQQKHKCDKKLKKKAYLFIMPIFSFRFCQINK